MESECFFFLEMRQFSAEPVCQEEINPHRVDSGRNVFRLYSEGVLLSGFRAVVSE